VAQWNKVAANATFKPGQSVVVYVTASAASAKSAAAVSGTAKVAKRSAVKTARAATAKKKKA